MCVGSAGRWFDVISRIYIQQGIYIEKREEGGVRSRVVATLVRGEPFVLVE